jgi:hypothetical protein
MGDVTWVESITLYPVERKGWKYKTKEIIWPSKIMQMKLWQTDQLATGGWEIVVVAVYTAAGREEFVETLHTERVPARRRAG